MDIHSNLNFKTRRAELRNNATRQERTLWQYLRKKKLGFTFQRQHSIGPYIVDFYCAEKRLVIELDGEQHKQNVEYDQERTKFLMGLNHIVLRFWNSEIDDNLCIVLEKIRQTLLNK